MPRIILIAAIALAAYILLKRTQALPPQRRKKAIRNLVITAAVIVVIVLTLTGRMHWIGAAITGVLVAARQMLPLLIRAFPLLQQWQQSRAHNQTQHSELHSALLKMTLNHETGELDGEVLSGPLSGWLLSELDTTQLETLRAYCVAQDNDSAELLEGYLEQRFASDDSMDSEAGAPTGDFNRAEALSILGLTEGATDEDIIKAHRQLIQKLHPDRGGNDYLAAKINQAKDFLLQ